jgi:hypothetical protein
VGEEKKKEKEKHFQVLGSGIAKRQRRNDLRPYLSFTFFSAHHIFSAS